MNNMVHHFVQNTFFKKENKLDMPHIQKKSSVTKVYDLDLLHKDDGRVDGED